MKRIGQVLGGTALGALGYLSWRSTGRTPPIRGTDGQPLPGSVAEWVRVQVRGTRQWICLRGHDCTKPVLLFLHGGPGLPELAILTGHAWERDFVVAYWEQRGAGKSYTGAVFDETFTVETFVEDAAAVTAYLRGRFGQDRIYLVGHSWGTLLGLLLAQRYPERFRALLCMSQIARQGEAEEISYDWVLDQARQRGHASRVAWLERQGRPPYPPAAWARYLTIQREWLAEYRGAMRSGNFYPLFIQRILDCRAYTLRDKACYGLGALRSVKRLWPEVVATDAFAQVPRLRVPYFVFQGVHDQQTPHDLARRYVEHVEAPVKQFFSFKHSAHSPFLEEPERFASCFAEAIRIADY
jgi:pimeloyl-ACP methyl ester carboxylesterase